MADWLTYRNKYGQLIVRLNSENIWSRLFLRKNKWEVEFKVDSQWERYRFDTYSEAYRFMVSAIG